jgi:hypothetical protein
MSGWVVREDLPLDRAVEGGHEKGDHPVELDGAW